MSGDKGWPVSVVNIGGLSVDGLPFASVRSAGCAFCDNWAVGLHLASRVVAEGEPSNSIEKRRDMTILYYCREHESDSSNELLGEYGQHTNGLDIVLELAHAVAQRERGR